MTAIDSVEAPSVLIENEGDAELRVEIVEMVALSDIDASGRMRPIDPQFVEAIAASMARDGQLSPIDICRLPGKTGFKLVFGGHRLAAARLLGWTHIAGIKRSANALERKSREIAENFFKASLSPLDMARFVSELIANEKARLGIADSEDGRALNADMRSKNAKQKQMDDDLCKMHKSLGLQEAVAARLGLNQTAVSRHLLLNSLPPEIVARVRLLPIADNASALRKLAGMEPGDQAKAVTLIESGRCKNVNEAAFAISQKLAVTPEKKRLRAFLDAFGRMSTKEKIDALKVLEGQLPKGVSLNVFKASEEQVLEWHAQTNAKVAAGTKPERMDANFNKEIMSVVRQAAANAAGDVAAPTERPTDAVDIEELLQTGNAA